MKSPEAKGDAGRNPDRSRRSGCRIQILCLFAAQRLQFPKRHLDDFAGDFTYQRIPPAMVGLKGKERTAGSVSGLFDLRDDGNLISRVLFENHTAEGK